MYGTLFYVMHRDSYSHLKTVRFFLAHPVYCIMHVCTSSFANCTCSTSTFNNIVIRFLYFWYIYSIELFWLKKLMLSLLILLNCFICACTPASSFSGRVANVRDSLRETVYIRCLRTKFQMYRSVKEPFHVNVNPAPKNWKWWKTSNWGSVWN